MPRNNRSIPQRAQVLDCVPIPHVGIVHARAVYRQIRRDGPAASSRPPAVPEPKTLRFHDTQHSITPWCPEPDQQEVGGRDQQRRVGHSVRKRTRHLDDKRPGLIGRRAHEAGAMGERACLKLLNRMDQDMIETTSFTTYILGLILISCIALERTGEKGCDALFEDLDILALFGGFRLSVTMRRRGEWQPK